MEDEDKILDDIDKSNASSELIDAFTEPFQSDNLSKSMFEALPGVFDDPVFGGINKTVVGGAVDSLDLGLRTIESGIKGGAAVINEAKNYITGQDDDRLRRDIVNFFLTAGVGSATSGPMRVQKGISQLIKEGKKDEAAKVILAESDAFKKDNFKEVILAQTKKREPSLAIQRKKSKLRTLFDELPESERALLPKQIDEFSIAGYHGTSKSRDMDKPFFDIKFGRRQDEFLGEGFYFTLDPKVASEYANMRAINQLDIVGKQGGQGLYSYRPTGQKVTTSTLLKGVDIDGNPIPVGQQVAKFDLSKLENPYVVKTTKDRIYLKENFQKIKDEGYDSVLFDNFKDRSKQIMVFPEHIGKIDEGSGAVKQATTSGERYIPRETNTISVFPKPEKLFPKGEAPKGGDYINPATGEVITDRNVTSANIKINPDGRASFKASDDNVDNVGTIGKGNSQIKANLFKTSAGWKWTQAPMGMEDIGTLVSVTHKGKHFYTLETDFTKGVNLKKYPNQKDEPKLRPTVVGKIELGQPIGTISVRGNSHNVYDKIKTFNRGGLMARA
tara:strand:+ start:3896 stop:5566 length:1671 start_codon:yes stop_codon:yes gene_type:complete